MRLRKILPRKFKNSLSLIEWAFRWSFQFPYLPIFIAATCAQLPMNGNKRERFRRFHGMSRSVQLSFILSLSTHYVWQNWFWDLLRGQVKLPLYRTEQIHWRGRWPFIFQLLENAEEKYAHLSYRLLAWLMDIQCNFPTRKWLWLSVLLMTKVVVGLLEMSALILSNK